ncbi:MAG: nuclear transport factor 2 family protein, partial [Planctomycetota bacterium]|nr:nuclear transport factor 2 family protein [Planctomycetota bacterium]
MDNVNLVESLYAAFDTGDIPSVLGAMSPEISWSEAEGNPYQPSGEAWIGPDSILNNLFMKLGEDWDEFVVHRLRFHDTGSSVIVEVRYIGTFKATGKSMDTQACHVWDIQDGKLTRFQ